MHCDPLSDFLTRIRNAQMAQHKVVEIPASNLKKEVTKILFDQGYILNYKFVDAKPQGIIKIALRYDSKTRRPAITELKRFSNCLKMYLDLLYSNSDLCSLGFGGRKITI